MSLFSWILLYISNDKFPLSINRTRYVRPVSRVVTIPGNQDLSSSCHDQLQPKNLALRDRKLAAWRFRVPMPLPARRLSIVPIPSIEALQDIDHYSCYDINISCLYWKYIMLVTATSTVSTTVSVLQYQYIISPTDLITESSAGDGQHEGVYVSVCLIQTERKPSRRSMF